MRVEQRIGRIDRIGQLEKKILIWNFFYKDSIDDRIYMRLYTKLRIFEEALGGMEEIIGDKLKLISKSKDYLEHNLTEEQIQRLLKQADQAIEYVDELEKQLDEKSSQLVAHDDFIQQSIQEARQFGRYIKAEDLIAYFETFIKEHYQPSTIHLVNRELKSFKIDLSIRAIVDMQEYWNKEKIRFSSALLDHQRLSRTTFIFSNKIAKNQASTEYINQFHPIIKFIAEVIQKKNITNPKKIVTASIVKNNLLDIPKDTYVYACQRFSFTTNVRVIERLEYRAKGLHSNKILSADQSELLINAITSEGRDWSGYGNLDTEKTVEIYGELLSKLENDFELRKNQLKRETNDRVAIQQNSLIGYMQNEKSRFDGRIEKAKDENREKYLKSLRTQWTNIENNLKIKHEKLEGQKNLSGTPSFVTVGLVHYQD